MNNLKISGILHQSIFMLYCQVLQRLQKIYFSNQSFFRHSLTFIWMDDESVTFFFLSPKHSNIIKSSQQIGGFGFKMSPCQLWFGK